MASNDDKRKAAAALLKPALDDEPPPPDDVWADKPGCSQLDEIRWVGEALAGTAQAEDSPSKFAWAMYDWARRDKTTFWRETIRAIVKSAEDETTTLQNEQFIAAIEPLIEEKLRILRVDSLREPEAA